MLPLALPRSEIEHRQRSQDQNANSLPNEQPPRAPPGAREGLGFDRVGDAEEEKCDGERELAQVSSSVGVVVMYSGHRFGTLGLRRHLSGPSLKVDDFW